MASSQLHLLFQSHSFSASYGVLTPVKLPWSNMTSPERGVYTDITMLDVSNVSEDMFQNSLLPLSNTLYLLLEAKAQTSVSAQSLQNCNKEKLQRVSEELHTRLTSRNFEVHQSMN